MDINWRIFYRGSLDSCNYDCAYCPFAKKKNTRAELEHDKKCLQQFTDWVKTRKENLHIMLTPWGEGLIRNYYQQAMIELSHLPQVKKIAIQTNLSCSMDWMQKVNKNTFALWVTYHPTEIDYQKFKQNINRLQAMNIHFSIGIVGKKEHIDAVQQLKLDFPTQYVWVNAYKDEVDYYSNSDIEQLNKLDKHFHLNLNDYKTKGEPCAAGETTFFINQLGDAYPCHFVKKKIGNIYSDEISELLKPSTCVLQKCDCYIGYINLKKLNLEQIYGQQILERKSIK